MAVDSSPFAGRERALRLRSAEQRVTDLTFRFPIDPQHGPLPGIDALDVGPGVLLHPAVVPQPDGEGIYELLTRHQRRDPGSLVYLRDLADDLEFAGATWSQLGVRPDQVTDALARLAAADRIQARLLWAPPHPTVRGGTPQRPAPPAAPTRPSAPPRGRLREWLDALHKPTALPR